MTRARGLEVIMRTGAEPTILHCIFWNNGDDLYWQIGNTGSAVIYNNCVQDRNDYFEGIVNDDPLFADSSRGDYRLTAGSPCIDAGLRGLFPDPDGGAADLGALYLYRPSPIGGAPITFRSAPIDGICVSLDSRMVQTPAEATWYPGYTHWIGAVQFHRVDQGTSYAFTGWDDGGERFRLIPGEASPKTYTANYSLRYRLGISNSPAADAVQGEGWHFADSAVHVSAEPTLDAGEGVRFAFRGWEGSGAGSYTGDQPSFQTVLRGPVQEKVNYDTQYAVSLHALPDTVQGIRVFSEPAGAWFPAGQILTLRAESDNPSYRFAEWDAGPSNTDGSYTLIVDGPKSVSARFAYFEAHPPTIISFPDTSVQEDDTLTLSDAWLAERIHDDGDPFSLIQLDFETDLPLRILPDSVTRAVRIVPEENWNGQAAVRLRAQDPPGEAAADTFELAVNPVPDPPGPFRLVSPDDGADIAESEMKIHFTWTVSENFDNGDSIRYRLVLGTDPERLDASASLDTTLDGTSAELSVPAGLLYFWSVCATDADGFARWAERPFGLRRPSGVAEGGSASPRRFGVGPNFPNPFNPKTEFDIQLPHDGPVRITVFDMRGSAVWSTRYSALKAGFHRIAWNGRSDDGRAMPSGVYSILFDLDGRVFRRKLTLAR